jgi:hypothetical protein
MAAVTSWLQTGMDAKRKESMQRDTTPNLWKMEFLNKYLLIFELNPYER